MLTPHALAQAQSQTHNALQNLTYTLERKGIITTPELAHVYGEAPEPAIDFRAPSVHERSERGLASPSRSHAAHTDSETRANKGKQSRAVDTGSSAEVCAVERKRMSKAAAAGAYKRALEFLEPRHTWRVYGIKEYVRCLRAEAGAWRLKARQAERRVELMKIELEEARRGAHE
jgi:hypothetical protein